MGARSRKLTRKGWLPLQHGGWAMIILPTLTGSAVGGWSWGQLLLLFSALSLFLCANAAESWSKARRNRRYWPAMASYAVMAILSGSALTALVPEILDWAWVLAPLMAVVALVWRLCGSASVVTRVLLVVACSVLTPLAALMGSGSPSLPELMTATLVVVLYLLGSLFHVRSLIRGRGNPAWWAASLAFHALLVVVALILAISNQLSWWLVLLFLALLARSWVIPWYDTRCGRVKPIVIGMTEEVSSVAVFAVTLVAI